MKELRGTAGVIRDGASPGANGSALERHERKSSLAFKWLTGSVPITADYGMWNGNVGPGCSHNCGWGRFELFAVSVQACSRDRPRIWP